jgi:O-antigen/teichoic acid export membrane protein
MSQPATDGQALARGGRQNVLGYVLRLGARIPFLFIAGRLYGAEELGRFAYAIAIVEFAAALAMLGLKRGLAATLANNRHRAETHIIMDGLLLVLLAGGAAAALLMAVPVLVFPTGPITPAMQLFPLVILFIVASDLTLTALAFRHRIAAQVRARAIVEPWVLTIAATAIAFTAWASNGLMIAYAMSLVAAATASIFPCVRLFGWPVGWRPSARRLVALARANLPLAGADAVEWSIRRVDVVILGRLAPPEIVGLYYVAQQIASLAGRLRSSFDPILAPMLSIAMAEHRKADAARIISQVGFWVMSVQFPVVLALILTADGTMGLFGPEFAAGGLILALLLAAELMGTPGAVTETGLVYSRPRDNLLVSAVAIGIAGGVAWLAVPHLGGEGAALGLLLALTFASVGRALLLKGALGTSAPIWRWSLLVAAVPAVALGVAARQLPELWMMALGIPAILVAYGVVIWRFGYREEDRLLFRAARARQKAMQDKSREEGA